MNTILCHKKIIFTCISFLPIFANNAIASTNSYGGQYTYSNNANPSSSVENNNTINLDGVTLDLPTGDNEFFSAKNKIETSTSNSNAMTSGTLTAIAGDIQVSNNSTLNGDLTGASNSVIHSLETGSNHPIYVSSATVSLTAQGKQIDINDSTIKGTVTGAKNESTGDSSNALGGIYATESDVTFSAKSGDITINNSIVTGDLIGATNRSVADQAYSGVSTILGSQVTFTASNDHLSLDNSYIKGSVIGASNYIEGWTNGLVAQTASGSFSAKGGMIDISNSSINGDIIGSMNTIIGVRTGIAISSNSMVDIVSSGGITTVTDSTVGSIYGARNDIISTNNGTAISIDDTSTLKLNATENTVNINGNTELRNIDDAGVVTYDAELWGGYINLQGSIVGTGKDDNIYRDSFTGNTLNFSASPITVAKMGNFENYNFSLNDNNKSLINTSTGLITVTDILQNDDTLEGSTITQNMSNVKLNGISGTVDINNGDRIILIDATGAVVSGGDTNQTGMAQVINPGEKDTVKVGLIKDVDIEYSFAGNDNEQLIATIIDSNGSSGNGNGGGAGTVNRDYIKQLKPLSESHLASLMAVNKGADLIGNAVWNQIGIQPQQTFKPFIIVQTGYDRYNSGSHIKSNTTAMVVGTSYQLNENFALGALYEYGNGSYDTYNSFKIGKVKGSGNTHYYGAGLIAKYTIDNAYIDASIRYGKSKTNYNNRDIVAGGGTGLKYHNTSNYWGGHLGGGFTYAINNQNILDTSLKYLVTELDGFNTDLEGSHLKFNKANSSRIQVGEKLTHQLNDTIAVRGGVAYQYEFNGKPRVKVDGYNINKASVKGSAGILELGVNLKPIQKIDQLTLDFATKGYVGKHEGVTGIATLSYNF